MMGELVSLLHEGGYSLVLQKDGKIHTFSERGVADLYRLRSENPELLQGAFLADKVVGKGAAALMILGGVAELHADVISEPALSLLAESPVRVSYGEKYLRSAIGPVSVSVRWKPCARMRRRQPSVCR